MSTTTTTEATPAPAVAARRATVEEYMSVVFRRRHSGDNPPDLLDCVLDRGYDTPACGWVSTYEGTALRGNILFVGTTSSGSPYYIYSQGRVWARTLPSRTRRDVLRLREHIRAAIERARERVAAARVEHPDRGFPHDTAARFISFYHKYVGRLAFEPGEDPTFSLRETVERLRWEESCMLDALRERCERYARQALDAAREAAEAEQRRLDAERAAAQKRGISVRELRRRASQRAARTGIII